MTDLQGRVALVTGGGRGIGAAIVRELHRRGAGIVIADNGTSIGGEGADPTIAETLADELGDGAIAYTQSIASPGSAAAAVGVCREAFGGLDILVNNAAILRDGFVFKTSPRDWDAVLSTNLSAPFYLCNAATPVLREQAKAKRGGDTYAWGRVVNIVSTAGFYGNYGQVAYASAKAGLLGLTRVVALDMARSGVTCNAIAPFAATRVTEIIQPANDEQAKYKERALRVSPKHVANMAAFLTTPAGQGVSGQLFGVRGREIFLFGQARPAVTVASSGAEWTDDELAAAIKERMGDSLEPLATDLEAFNTEPIV